MGDARHSHPKAFVLIYSHSMNRKAVEALSGASDGRPCGSLRPAGIPALFWCTENSTCREPARGIFTRYNCLLSSQAPEH